MLFDLKGKRHRTVQGVYLTLAILMGAGLVLFGIGSSGSGGLFDAFDGGSGSSKGNETAQKQIDAANKRLKTNPKNAVRLAALMRGHYFFFQAEDGIRDPAHRDAQRQHGLLPGV